VFLRRSASAASWVLSVVSTDAWRVDYPDRGAGVPAILRLASVGGNGNAGERFNLQLALSQVETNTPLDAAAFRVDVPRDAVPITLDELRHARPGLRQD